MSATRSDDRAELERLRKFERYYCPLGREMNVELARLRSVVGEALPTDDDMLRAEVEQLHAEREWLCEELATALGRPLSDVRVMMRRQFSHRYALAVPLSGER